MLKHPWLKKIIIAALLVEVVYVLLFNLALRLPATQTLINEIKPDKFYVSWQKAWTWYPFRFHIRGVNGNGQSRSQQWEFEAGSVTASIDVLPLMFKRVWINDVRVTDASYRQRPRLKPEKDYSGQIEYFPPISGREITDAVATPLKKKRPWHVDIDDIELSGQYEYWIHRFKGQAKGGLEADLSVVSRGGLFSLQATKIDLDLSRHFFEGAGELFRRGVISGDVGFVPFVPRDNKGIKMLPYALVNADINVEVNSLAFIDVFTSKFHGMKVDGAGLVDGRLHMLEGVVQDGTDLTIDATDLQVRVLSHNIEGDGTIGIQMSEETGGLLDLDIEFNKLVLSKEDDAQPLLTGHGLGLNAKAGGDLTRNEEVTDERRSISVDIEGLTVPDLALYQRYLPEKWPFQLFGGNGNLQGHASLSTDTASVDLRITSEAAQLGTNEYHFDTDLDLAIKLDNPALRSSPTFITGSYIKLSDASLVRDVQDLEKTRPWNATFMISEGHYSVFETDDKMEKENTLDLFKMLGQSDTKQLVGGSNGSLQIESDVSSLAWIGVLMNEKFHSSTSGSGTVNGVLNIESGLPAAGTDIEVISDAMVLTILDYEASGDGKVVFQVEEGGGEPNWLLSVDLINGDLKRAGETSAAITDVDLMLRAKINDMGFKKKDRKFALEFEIPEARVTDMSMFNQYLPPDSPVKFIGGTADLMVDILLQDDDADGYLKLKADNLQAQIDQQQISTDFSANITLVDGEPGKMFFDISGSELRLDNVRVSGDNDSFDQQNWAAVLTLNEAETVWAKPLLLNAEAVLSMTDSRPIVAMIGNQKDRPQWVKNMLTVEDIKANVTLDIADERIVIPYAFMDSDNIDFGAKAVIDGQRNDGMIYARYKKLHVLVKINDGKKNIDLIRAKTKFDRYQPLANGQQ